MLENNNHYQVSAFVYYMANVWCKEEAIRIFGKVMGEHFWNKWADSNNNADESTLKLYYGMTSIPREMLVTAAIEHYKNSEWINNQ